jgi:hypothetical protein
VITVTNLGKCDHVGRKACPTYEIRYTPGRLARWFRRGWVAQVFVTDDHRGQPAVWHARTGRAAEDSLARHLERVSVQDVPEARTVKSG